MDYYVLRVDNASRGSVLADLASAPGRTILFTRTKHGARKLARQLVDRGIPAVDLHGNLSQNARTRNLAAFESGTVETLVATDIAARGIHVDDVALVVHADPPVEHKAYLHRSGRTARAGQSGTVITLVTPEQRGDVSQMMRKAGIKPSVAEADRQVLVSLAPGERVVLSPDEARALAQPHVNASQPPQQPRSRQGGQPRRRPQSGGTGRSGGSGRSGRSEGSLGRSSGPASSSPGSSRSSGGRRQRHAGRPTGAA